MFGTYENLLLLAATVKMEAEDQPQEGKLAVAYVVMNRVRQKHKSITDIVLQRLAFSAWNADSPTRQRLDEWTEELWDDCFKASVAAYYQLVPDPTKGATHYLNEALTRKIRGGTLPPWVEAMTKTVVIGQHTFLKEAS